MWKFLLVLSVLVSGACRSKPAAAPPSPAGPPWLTDVKAAREAALREGRPCVLIAHVNSSAL